jgi:hypothetical protein
MSGNSPAAKTSESQPVVAGSAAWIENWFRPTVTAAMLTCLVVAFVGLASRIVPGWRGPHYVAFAFLVSWEGIQSERLLRRRGPGYSGHFRYRAVEAVVILVLFELIHYVSLGWEALWADVLRWGQDPSTFLDYGFVIGGMSILVLWMAAIAITKSLYLLEVHPSEIPPDPRSPDYDRWRSDYSQRVDRQAVLRDIVHHYFWGGMVLLILTGLARFDVPFLYRYRPPPLSGLVVNTMFYFALGLVLISQAHFSILQVSWRVKRIDVSPRLGTRWAWQAVAFLSLITVVALVLPTGYSVGLPQAIAFAANLIVGTLYFVVSSVFYLLALLLGLISYALGLRAEPMAPQRPPPVQLSSFPPVDPGTTSSLPRLELLKSVLFWGIFLAIVGYSVYHFLRERQELFPGLEGSLLARLFAWLRGLWQHTRQWSAQVRQAVVTRLGRRSERRERFGPWRVIRLSRLSPRQQVRYFYFSVLRRAARANHARRPQQTPYEYGATLAERVPETAPDVATLTRAFVEARYSQRSLSEQEANVVKRVWLRVRATLARRRRSYRSSPNTQEESHELAR